MTKIFNLYLIGTDAIKFKSSEFFNIKETVHVIPIDEFFHSLKELVSDPNSLVSFDYKNFGKFYVNVQKLSDGVITSEDYVFYIDSGLLIVPAFCNGLDDLFVFAENVGNTVPLIIRESSEKDNYKDIMFKYTSNLFDMYNKTGAVTISDSPCTIEEFLHFVTAEKKSILKKYFRDNYDYKSSYFIGLFALSFSNLFLLGMDKKMLFSLNLSALTFFCIMTCLESIRFQKNKLEKSILYDRMLSDVKEKYFLMPDDEEKLLSETESSRVLKLTHNEIDN